MNSYSQAISQIIRQQQAIIGPVALDQAKKVTGLKVADIEHVDVTGNGKEVLASLVKQYSSLFGQASVEVCKDAVREIKPPLPPEDLPEILL